MIRLTADVAKALPPFKYDELVRWLVSAVGSEDAGHVKTVTRCGEFFDVEVFHRDENGARCTLNGTDPATFGLVASVEGAPGWLARGEFGRDDDEETT